MDDILIGVLVTLGVLAAVGVAAYFVLRRMFERAAHRVADDLGRVLADVTAGGVRARPAGAGAARGPAGRVTPLHAYAAAEGMSEEDARREFADSIERTARLMDAAVRLPVIGPVGLDPLLGLFPVAGDIISAAVSVSLIGRSIRYGVPREIIARMLGNVLVDLLVGAIPVAGDLADIWFRANMRNVALLRAYLADEERNTIDINPTRVG